MTGKMLLKQFEPGHGFSRQDWDEVSDNPEWTEEDIRKAKPFAEVFPELMENIRRSRGRPKLDAPKEAVTLRLDPATVAKFKGAGPDWRTRMAEALKRARVK